MMEVVPIAAALGLTCPEHGCQLEDAIGPYWCPEGHDVSAWEMLVRTLLTYLEED